MLRGVSTRAREPLAGAGTAVSVEAWEKSDGVEEEVGTNL